MTTTPDTEPPVSELAQLRAWMDRFRETVERKTADLDPSQLAERSVSPSTLSLLGLVRHLAQMEHHWFVLVLQQADEPKPFVPDGDWEAQFRDAVGTTGCADEAFSTWRSVIGRADAFLDELPDEALSVVIGEGDVSTIRDVLLQVLQEYARHAGHMDLLRECVDGRTGE